MSNSNRVPSGPDPLNPAKQALINYITSITDEEEIDQLRLLVIQLLAEKVRKSGEGEGRRLGVDTREGADEFLRNNHYRTPYRSQGPTLNSAIGG